MNNWVSEKFTSTFVVDFKTLCLLYAPLTLLTKLLVKNLGLKNLKNVIILFLIVIQ